MPRWVPDSVLRDNQDVGPYTAQVNGPGGVAQTPRAIQGTSVKKLLTALGYDPAAVGSVSIPRPGAPGTYGTTPVVLGTDQILHGFPAQFGTGCAGSCQAVFDVTAYPPGGAMRFFRPLASAGDVNVYDDVVSARDAPLEASVATTDHRPITVTVTANPATADPGQAVTLSALTPGAPTGTTVSWDFGDGSVDTGTSVTHTYASAGRYEARASAFGPGDASGTDAMTIQVGPRDGAGQASTPSPVTGDAGSGSGGNGSGGGTANAGAGSGAANSAVTGAATSPSTPTSGRGRQTGRTPTKTPATTAPRSGDVAPPASSSGTRLPSGSGTTAASATGAPGAATTTSPSTATSPSPGATSPSPTSPAGSSDATGPTPPAGTGGRIEVRGVAVASRGRDLAAA
ncbi:MAG: PKD domain-containing protein, partial [Solirubrobacteraceae bacterium]|nr:PKD domain-containing protein [Patulibacter sp.]